MEHKLVAMTADNVSNMDVAARNQQILKCGCVVHLFNLAAQKICTIATVSRSAPKISVTSLVSA